MRTQVFAYRGAIGINSNKNAEGLINRPGERGQLGFVANAAFVDISPEALSLLKTIKPSNDDIGDVDVFKAANGVVVFSWLGHDKKAFYPAQVTGSNHYQPDLLVASDNVEIPDEFKDHIDSISSDFV